MYITAHTVTKPKAKANSLRPSVRYTREMRQKNNRVRENDLRGETLKPRRTYFRIAS